MAVCPPQAVVLGLLGWLLVWTVDEARGDTCYSKHSGFRSCSGGCCGASGDQDCCSRVFMIVGLALTGAVIGVVSVTVVVCWVCRERCPKPCGCWGGDRRRRRRRGDGEERGRRGGRRLHTRRVLVHPVAPPDYSTATQERAPSVQPGLNNRVLPVSPPPPYVETVPPPPPTPLHKAAPREESCKITVVAVPAVSRPASVVHPASERGVSVNVDGQPSRDVNGSSGESTVNTGHGVLVVQSSASESPAHRISTNAVLTLSGEPTSTAGSLAPGETALTTSRSRSPSHLLHVREPPRTDDSEAVQGTSSPQGTAPRPHNPVPRTTLQAISESAEDGDQLYLV